ncbi:MAG: hypothetical protein KF685_11815 [Acidobacteria bacterium]|nr:hypothetical protein [Acidobacteriota bacterium]
MQYTGIIKRLVPFFLTFAVGLLVASFFVPLSFPSLSGLRMKAEERRSRIERMRYGRHEVMRENRQLKEEVIRLRERVAEMESGKGYVRYSELPSIPMNTVTEEVQGKRKDRKPRHPRHPKHEIHE